MPLVKSCSPSSPNYHHQNHYSSHGGSSKDHFSYDDPSSDRDYENESDDALYPHQYQQNHQRCNSLPSSLQELVGSFTTLKRKISPNKMPPVPVKLNNNESPNMVTSSVSPKQTQIRSSSSSTSTPPNSPPYNNISNASMAANQSNSVKSQANQVNPNFIIIQPQETTIKRLNIQLNSNKITQKTLPPLYRTELTIMPSSFNNNASNNTLITNTSSANANKLSLASAKYLLKKE